MKNLFGETEFVCHLADPPWPERGGGGRGAQNHYPTLGQPGKNVAEPMVGAIRSMGWSPAQDAHLWIWVTDNYLQSGMDMYPMLGFRFVRTYPWIKVKVDETGALLMVPDPYVSQRVVPKLDIGIGQYARGAHEILLFGVRGKGQSDEVWGGDRGVASPLFAPVPKENGRRIHSRKPPESYALIERVSRGPRVEYFSRVARPGWVARGNEAA